MEQLIKAQTDIGWRNFIDGFLSTQWANTQQQYLDWIQSRSTGSRWVSKLMKHLWGLSWKMWRHRQDINATPESQTLAAIHDQLDIQIAEQFEIHATTNLTRLNRWFSQPLESLRSEDEDFKLQWLEAVHAARNVHE